MRIIRYIEGRTVTQQALADYTIEKKEVYRILNQAKARGRVAQEDEQ